MVLREWKTEREEETRRVSDNTMVIVKSRKVEYEIESLIGKWFVITAKVSGACDPDQGF